MQKKLLALAVAGALAPAAAVAQQSTVEIYGRANLSIDNWRATGASTATANFKSRARIVDSGSRVGFRVNENLGGGLRAFAVIESGANIDSGTGNGQSGAANTSTGMWASRDSYLGLGGGWGDVRWGRQSIWWSNGLIAQTGANYINSAVDGITTGSFGAVGGPVARQSNVISYNSPTFGGFNATVSYGTNSEGATYTGTGQEKDTVWGFTGRYSAGALRAQFDWARRSNIGFVNDADNTGWKAGIGWAYAPGSQISWVHERLTNKNAATLFGTAGTFENRKVRMNLLNWEHTMGQWAFYLQHVFTGKVQGLNADPGNTRAKGWTLAGKYFLSKRTGAYVSLNMVRNESNAWADLSGGGFSSGGVGPAAGLGFAHRGADPRVIAVGVMHNF